MEEAQHVGRERRAAGQRDPQPSAEPLLHLRVDEPVREAVLRREAARDGLAVPPGARTRAPRRRAPSRPAGASTPVASSKRATTRRGPSRRCGGRSGTPSAGRRAARRRPCTGRRRRRGEAGVRPREVHEAAEVVREREVEEQDVAGAGVVVHLVADRDHRVVVAVADHAALRRAGRARRVDVGEEVVLGDRASASARAVGFSAANSRPLRASSSRPANVSTCSSREARRGPRRSSRAGRRPRRARPQTPSGRGRTRSPPARSSRRPAPSPPRRARARSRTAPTRRASRRGCRTRLPS